MGDPGERCETIGYSVHRAGGPLSINANSYPAGGGVALHRHRDFSEVFWIVRGDIEHVVGGRPVRLGPGHLQFIEAQTRHRMRAGAQGFTVVNVAVRLPELARWRRQEVFGPRWPWFDSDPVQLDHRAVARLQQALGSLPAVLTEVDRLWLVASVVREANQARQRPGSASPEPPPDWLAEALVRWQAGPPEAGVPELAAAAGRSREHLARTVRRHFATSPSHLLNQVRCDRAAALLRDGSRPILDLALDSGFANLGQFYRCFQARFGTSPRRYREGFRGVI